MSKAMHRHASHRLVTLIEIVSPSNKRGKDRTAFVDKQNKVIASDASLVQIDLLRTGHRILPSDEIEQRLQRRKTHVDYLVLIVRAWDRTPSRQHYQLFPFTLPVIPIPLREDDAEPTLNLPFLFQRVYDGGPYRRGAVNYAKPPNPPLAEVEWTWAEQLLTPRKPSPALLCVDRSVDRTILSDHQSGLPGLAIKASITAVAELSRVRRLAMKYPDRIVRATLDDATQG